ncbi:MAG TPA: type III-A CRISPR-associated RAMP protein Csm3 [bacterium]|nr:type III-A CRISPR-associated RAMP protein Csm3 [bacterium]
MTKISKIYTIKGDVTLRTGLHIGAGNEAVEIGGSDAPVVKDLITGAPYIPGSSLKGRMRWLLEKTRGEYNTQTGKVGEDNSKLSTLVFGNGNSRDTKSPTRIIFKDAKLTDNFEKEFKDGKWEPELKMETAIDRISGKAMGGSLRNAERVPAGVKFEYEVSLMIFEGDKEDEIKKMIEDGFKLIEMTYLGGRGTRGYGQVEFSNKNNWIESWK